MSGRFGRGEGGGTDRRERGAVFILTAIALPVLLLMTSFAIDLGRQRVARRDMQAKADVIALDLARIIDGSLVGNINYSAPLAASAARNDVPLAKITNVRFGTLNASKKFDVCMTANCIPTAVEVTAADSVDRLFSRGKGSVVRKAVAATDAIAGFSIGSFAAAVNSGGGPLLNSLIGNALHLGALSYTGLATTSLTYLGLATELGLANPNELFSGNVNAYEAVRASADILRRGGSNAAQVAVLDQVLAVPNSPLRNVTVGQLVQVQAGTESAALGSSFNVFDLLAGGAFLSNGSQGLTLPTTTLNLPGVSFAGSVSLIQGPQTFFGRVGDPRDPPPVSQASVNGTFTVGTSTVGNRVVSTLQSLVPGICGLLLLGPVLCGLTTNLVTIDVTASVNVNLASARGQISGIGCGATKTLDLAISSTLLTSSVSFSAVVKAGGTPVLTVPLSVTTPSPAFSGSAHFDLPPEQYGVFKPSNPGSGAIGLDSTTISGLGALGDLVNASLNTLLNNATAALNTNIVLPLTKALGARVAGADVAAREHKCGSVILTA